MEENKAIKKTEEIEKTPAKVEAKTNDKKSPNIEVGKESKPTQEVKKEKEVSKQSENSSSDKKSPNSNAKQRQNSMRRRPKNSVGDNFEERVVKTKRISKTTKGGRRMRFSTLVIIGDKNGRVGFGIGKSVEVPVSIKKAVKNARKSIMRLPMTKKHTVYHEIIGRKGASRVLIKPAPTGTGIIAGGVIRDLIELAGYHDVYTKNMGSNAPLNMVLATLNGLKNQLIPGKVMNARDLVSKKEEKPKENK